ncbi:MAG TPA: DmsE family decaheme c-type cytochrome [Candidatus Methylomirabilis sp.]|jgi:DmsE family decaheme c-type cytochrome|nr:DmsE family decaheme c-type cytochrome [Candidatus Methylomirabilis sp.]
MREAPPPGLRASLLLLGLLFLSLPSVAAAQPQAPNGYVGSDTCLTCHEPLKDAFAKTMHAKVFTEQNARTPLMLRGCEACHGPGKAHVEAGGGKGVGGLTTFRRETAEAVEKENAVCLTCHEKGKRLYWQGSPHEGRDVGCTSCHQVMQRTSEKALLAKASEIDTCAQCHLTRRSQTFRNAHMPLREGKMTCTSCHNPHGTVSKALLPVDSPNDNCYRCHADKRGPFLWEHAPVAENCMNCHDPHGGVRDKMLKLSPPRVCQQCHVESRHPTEARLPTNKFVIGRACLQCHQNIHGSNHPSGFAFTR